MTRRKGKKTACCLLYFSVLTCWVIPFLRHMNRVRLILDETYLVKSFSLLRFFQLYNRCHICQRFCSVLYFDSGPLLIVVVLYLYAGIKIIFTKLSCVTLLNLVFSCPECSIEGSACSSFFTAGQTPFF